MKAMIKVEREIEFEGEFCSEACDLQPGMMHDWLYCRIIGQVVHRDGPSYLGPPRRHLLCIAATEAAEKGEGNVTA